MPDTTHTEGTLNTPTAYAWCAWHKAYSSSARLVRIIEQGSGVGGSLFACASCRERHGLVPVADQP